METKTKTKLNLKCQDELWQRLKAKVPKTSTMNEFVVGLIQQEVEK